MDPDAPADHHDADADAGVRRVRRGTGPRARAQREAERARKAARIRRAGLGLLLVGVVLAAVPFGRTAMGWFGSDGEPSEQPTELASSGSEAPLAAERRTVLVATFGDDGGAATALQLLTFDPGEGTAASSGAVVFLPVSLLTDVPGYGPTLASDAGAFGGAALIELAVENALGIAIDTTLTMTEQSWGALFARLDGFEVEVREPLLVATPQGTNVRRFEAGPQFLDGPRLAELLVFEVAGESELARFPRAQQVLDGFLQLAAAAETGLDPVFADGAPMLDTPDGAAVEEALRGLVAAARADALELRTVPVTAVGAGDGAYYRLDAARAVAFVTDVLGGAVDATVGTDAGVRLEVLNGNGRIGVGADVGALLVPLGHTVVITRNADDFDHAETIVRLHDDTDELLAVAAEIVETLGVGRIEISAVPSSTVDMTIVVGADFRG